MFDWYCGRQYEVRTFERRSSHILSSTADGAILAMGTVFSHNIARQLGFVSENTLLMFARLSTIPFAIAATLIAAYYRTSHSAGTGYLLIVAFDVTLATVVAPLFGCFYLENPSPRAALLSIVLGAITRITLEFAFPKDGFLLYPFKSDEFLDYGSAANSAFPIFFDEPEVWDPTDGTCSQPRFEDYTGVDSLTAFGVSIVSFVLIQVLESACGGAVFNVPGLTPYEKNLDEEKDEMKGVEE